MKTNNSPPDNLSIDVCVCTFQRDHITKTLLSLSQLSFNPTWQVRFIIADNDDTPSAQMSVDRIAKEYALKLKYLHAPARNISVARNACLDASTADLIAFIDDDEIATATWLNELVTALYTDGADIALGPVQAIYGTNSPDWIRNGDFHSTKPVWVDGAIKTGYSCNVLFHRTSACLKDLKFRNTLGKTGGEDTVFFSDAVKAGGLITYTPQALVMEVVPQNRANLLWLLKRTLRTGQTHGLLLLEMNNFEPMGRFKNLGLAVVKAIYCLLGVVFSLFSAIRLRYWLIRAARHVGVISRLLGTTTLVQYGQRKTT